MKKQSVLKTKKIMLSLAGISLLAGFFFLGEGITGNAILEKNPSINIMSTIGIGLVFSSMILAFYTLKKELEN